ncbi:hypothetical protein MMC24_002307 [Lignoscripta atroalba]|nr:hypothetical protein [Lignoscripta atroalba]
MLFAQLMRNLTDSDPASSSPSPSNTQNTDSSTPSDSPSATITESPETSGTAKLSATETSGRSAAASTGASTAKQTGSSKTTKKATPTSIDPRLPAGGIEMVTPSAIAQASYYKIGDSVTFAWNYTSLSVTPSAIDVLVSCAGNGATYTLASNSSVAPTGIVTWDTRPEETGANPLLTDTYTLIIHDAAKDVTAVPSPGYLGAYDQFTFGMYIPQQYTPLNEYVCATCNSALSDMERQTLKFLFGMGVITIMSFTWFAGGFGVLF